jgi:hypothetical protein
VNIDVEELCQHASHHYRNSVAMAGLCFGAFFEQLPTHTDCAKLPFTSKQPVI